MTPTDRLATPCGYCGTRDVHTPECRAEHARLYPGMRPAPTFCTCPPRSGAGVRTETWEHQRTCPVRHPLRCPKCGMAAHAADRWCNAVPA